MSLNGKLLIIPVVFEELVQVGIAWYRFERIVGPYCLLRRTKSLMGIDKFVGVVSLFSGFRQGHQICKMYSKVTICLWFDRVCDLNDYSLL